MMRQGLLALACVALTDRGFGAWALDAWVPFSDQVLARFGGLSVQGQTRAMKLLKEQGSTQSFALLRNQKVVPPMSYWESRSSQDTQAFRFS